MLKFFKPTKPVKASELSPLVTDQIYGMNKSVRWGRAMASGASECDVVVENAVEELLSLSSQFSSGVPGWQAVLLNMPGFVLNKWLVRSTQEIVHQMLLTVLPDVHRCYVYLLSDKQVMLVTRGLNLVQTTQLIQKLSEVLQSDDNVEKTTSEVFDLGQTNLEFQNACNALASKTSITADTNNQMLLTPDQLTTFKLTDVQLNVRLRRSDIHVLVVEDDMTTAALLVQLLNQQCMVSSAYDAVSAVTEYRHIVPDLVLLDIGLPDVSGLDLLKKMVKGDPYSCVVMLTANAFKNNIDAALQAGAKGFMGKPFNRERLTHYTELAIRLKKQRTK